MKAPFAAAGSDAAKASAKPIALVFPADWCPACRAQAPLLKDLSQKPEFSWLSLCIANYDQEKDLKKSLGVSDLPTSQRGFDNDGCCLLER
jgi:thioredoxin 1